MKRLLTLLILCSALAPAQDTLWSVPCTTDSMLSIAREFGQQLRTSGTLYRFKLGVILAYSEDTPPPTPAGRPNGFLFTDFDSLIAGTNWTGTGKHWNGDTLYGSLDLYTQKVTNGLDGISGKVLNPHNADSSIQWLLMPKYNAGAETCAVRMADSLGWIDSTYTAFVFLFSWDIWSPMVNYAYPVWSRWHNMWRSGFAGYGLSNGLSRQLQMTHIALWAHELYHAFFGWRDEYNYIPNSGYYDLMCRWINDACPPFPNPGDRIEQNWITPTTLTNGALTVTYQYPATLLYQNKANPYGKYSHRNVNLDTSTYYLIQEQLSTGFDAKAPKSATGQLVIWKYYVNNYTPMIETPLIYPTATDSDYVVPGFSLVDITKVGTTTTIDQVTTNGDYVLTFDATVNNTTATLNGMISASGEPTGAWFVYGEISGTYGDTICVNEANHSGTYPITANIENLTAGTRYFFRSEMILNDSLYIGNVKSFRAGSTVVPPEVTTLTATSISTTTATLNGQVDPKNDSTKVWFARGIISGVYTNFDSITVKIYGSGTMAVSKSISGLTSGQTYYVRCYAYNSAGRDSGAEVSFTTTISAGPTVNLYNASFGTTTANFFAQILWGGWTGSVSGYYGTDSLPTTFISTLYNSYSYYANLSGLSPGTKYYYGIKVKWTASDSSWTVKSFTTLSDLPAAPTATTTDPPDSIGISSAKFLGTITSTVPATVWFAYKKTSASTWDTVTVAGTDSGTGKSVYYWKYALDIATEYQYKCGATNAGGTGAGDAVTFLTLTTSPTVVMGAARRLSVSSVALSGTVNANGLTTTPYFLWGTRHIYTDSSASHPTTVSGTTTTTIRDTITGLQLDSTYYVIIGAKNSDDQYVRSNEVSFLVVSTPTVSADSAGTITQASAIIYGHGNPHGLPTTFSFVWYSSGRSQSGSKVFNQVNFSSPHDTAFSYGLTGLSPDTTYSFYLSGRNTLGTVQDTANFATLGSGQPTSIPALRNLIAGAITETTATLTAEVNPGGEGTAITWYWGAESAAEDSVSGTEWVAISKDLTGLAENTIYADSVKAENVNGSVTLGGAFQTLAAPVIITGRVIMVRERIP